jgi:hypothetical protein
VFLDKDEKMENVQKHNICTNIPSSQVLDVMKRGCGEKVVKEQE